MIIGLTKERLKLQGSGPCRMSWHNWFWLTFFHICFYVESLPRTFGRKSDSSTSKLDVSVGLLTSGVNGGSVSLKCCQSKPLKNGWFMKSSMPFWPRRFSGVAIRRHIMSFASSDTSSMSSGNFNCAWNELKIHNNWWQVAASFKLSTMY